MVSVDTKKTVQLYFYILSIERNKKSADETPYHVDAIVAAFSQLFTSITAKMLIDRKFDLKPKNKIIWLDSFTDLKNGSFDLVFKSAKYLQSRVVRNTDTMESRGVLKQPEDGDEELTHMCIRFRKGSDRFVVACEFNYYGIGTGDIEKYLNDQFERLQAEKGDPYTYKVTFDMMPSSDFLTELAKMKKINVLRITMDIDDIAQGDFQRFAGRDELRPTVEVYLHKKRGKGNNMSRKMIEEIYGDTSSTKKIKKIAVEGANESGCLKIDSESIQMKHSIIVETLSATHEVVTSDFFAKADDFIREMRV